MPYYTKSGTRIYNPIAYAKTGAPMYKSFYSKNGEKIYNPKAYINSGGDLYVKENINQPKSIYKIECEGGKIYIGETKNLDKRMDQHFSGKGAKVTKKFKPIEGKELAVVPGYLAKKVEQEYTEKYIDKYGYNNVRGGKYVNSKTLKSTNYDIDDYDDSDIDDYDTDNTDDYDDSDIDDYDTDNTDDYDD
jgi:predicted GIY-YIG superfamily endonuclease